MDYLSMPGQTRETDSGGGSRRDSVGLFEPPWSSFSWGCFFKEKLGTLLSRFEPRIKTGLSAPGQTSRQTDRQRREGDKRMKRTKRKHTDRKKKEWK